MKTTEDRYLTMNTNKVLMVTIDHERTITQVPASRWSLENPDEPVRLKGSSRTYKGHEIASALADDQLFKSLVQSIN